MAKLTINTSKRVCFWGAASKLPRTARTIKECMRECGENTGNLFIGNGFESATQAPKKEYWDFYGKNPQEFDDKFDVLFVPASNFIFEYTDLTDQYNFFSKTKAQIFMFGLGSQLREIKPVKLTEGTEKFIRLVAERSHTIGVRGEITADVMEKLGISNVRVTGCPSLLDLPEKFSAPPANIDDAVVAGNFTNNAREHAFSDQALTQLESELFRELMRRRGYYILQNERHEIALLKSLIHSESLDEQDYWHLNRVKELFLLNEEYSELIDYLRWRSKIFFSVHEWVRFMRTVDFSFGTRFHGNVAAVLAGKPTFMFCHDYRTLELARFYRLPHRLVDPAKKTPTLQELCAESDMSHLQAAVPELLSIWQMFVSENGFTSNVSRGTTGAATLSP